MTEDLSHGCCGIRDGAAVPPDGVIDRQPAFLGAVQHEGGGKRLTDVGDRVGRVGRGADARFHILEAEPAFPDDLSVLHERRGHAGDAGLGPERLEIALERRRGDDAHLVLAGLHPGQAQGQADDECGKSQAHRYQLGETLV